MSNAVQTGVLRILIVEDNPGDVLLIQEALREQAMSFKAEVANDGEKALAFLERAVHDPQVALDLILLDLNLGTHHGTEILAHIRRTPGLMQVPVIVLTSSNSPADREQASRLGANLYIRKPLDLYEFLRIGEQIAGVLQ